MEISCQLSYSLNSETARPFGIFNVYLFWSSAAWIAIPQTTAYNAYTDQHAFRLHIHIPSSG
jgi:hypothetical protein